MKNVIYYVSGAYSDCENYRNLSISPSAITKINYIKSVLKEIGFYVSLCSFAECTGEKNCVNFTETVKIDEQEDVYYMFSFGRTNFALKYLSRIVKAIQLFIFFLFKVGNNDKILIYHSLQTQKIVNIVKWICKRQIYFEVEEIYHAKYGSSEVKIKSEIEHLKRAKGYIFVNDIIQKKCGIDGNSAVCYGCYNMPQSIAPKCVLDDKIHIVYAGEIGPVGSDVFLVLEIAKYLPSNYHIHISGYGNKQDINMLQECIINIKMSNSCLVTYEGYLPEKDYLNFLSMCDIGLCTRVLDDEMSDYEFPSKILVYLNNNLFPICPPKRSIQESQISNYVVFYENPSAIAIAKAISSVDVTKKNNYQEVLQWLHLEFVQQMKSIFAPEI